MSQASSLALSELQAYLDFAMSLAKQAGPIARQYFAYDTAIKSKADDSSPITVADEQINQLVIEKVKATYLGMGVLGEEASLAATNDDKLLWVLDPIDGTIPYTLHMPISTFCLALVKDGEPIIGVVYDFMADRLYSAIKGEGVWLNGEPFAPDMSVEPMKLVFVERWFAAANDVSKQHAALRLHGYQTPNYASSGYCHMMVALRKVSGLVYAGDKPWDAAASKVILNELGVLVTNLDGNEQRYDGTIRGAIIAYPEVHKLLVTAN